jgi:hypothetical protein
MHQGPIKLPEPLQARCVSLINLGSLMQLYSITLFIRVMEVHARILNDALTIMDLQDLMKLCDAVSEHPDVNDSLKSDIDSLKHILNVFIDVASCATRPCGMWTMVELEFDEDQNL